MAVVALVAASWKSFLALSFLSSGIVGNVGQAGVCARVLRVGCHFGERGRSIASPAMEPTHLSTLPVPEGPFLLTPSDMPFRFPA